MITLPQLKALARQNKIHFTCVKKDEIIKQLIDNNIITPFELIDPKIMVEPAKHNMVKSGHEDLKGIRSNPKTVEVFDKQTGKTSIFPSMYKTRRAFKISPT